MSNINEIAMLKEQLRSIEIDLQRERSANENLEAELRGAEDRLALVKEERDRQIADMAEELERSESRYETLSHRYEECEEKLKELVLIAQKRAEKSADSWGNMIAAAKNAMNELEPGELRKLKDKSASAEDAIRNACNMLDNAYDFNDVKHASTILTEWILQWCDTE